MHSFFSLRERKGWSHDGEHVLSECNRLYLMVIEVALLYRRQHELSELWTISKMGAKARGDIIEGILGLAHRWELESRSCLAIKSALVGIVQCIREIWNSNALQNMWSPLHLAQYILNDQVFMNRTVTVFPAPFEHEQYEKYVASVVKKPLLRMLRAKSLGKGVIGMIDSYLTDR